MRMHGHIFYVCMYVYIYNSYIYDIIYMIIYIYMMYLRIWQNL